MVFSSLPYIIFKKIVKNICKMLDEYCYIVYNTIRKRYLVFTKPANARFVKTDFYRIVFSMVSFINNFLGGCTMDNATNNVTNQDKTYKAVVLQKTFTAPDKSIVKYYDVILYIQEQEIHCKVNSNQKSLLTYLLNR